MEAHRYVASVCDATSEVSLTEDQLFLRTSVESDMLKQEKGIDSGLNLQKSSSAVVQAALLKTKPKKEKEEEKKEEKKENSAPVGKRRLCVVCNVQVAKNLPKLNGRFY